MSLDYLLPSSPSRPPPCGTLRRAHHHLVPGPGLASQPPLRPTGRGGGAEEPGYIQDSLQEVSIVNGRLVRGADNSGSIMRGHCAYLKAAAHLKAQVAPGQLPTRRALSGSRSLSDPLMISRFEELRVCMLAYCGNNSRISIAANAGANRFSVIHKFRPPPSFGTNEAPALPYPPPSPLRWLRHPSAVRQPSFWHI